MPRSPERRRAVRRDIFASLSLVAAIFVSIVALPFGKVHEGACSVASYVFGRKVPRGLSELSVTLDTDRRPFVFVSLRQLR